MELDAAPTPGTPLEELPPAAAVATDAGHSTAALCAATPLALKEMVAADVVLSTAAPRAATPLALKEKALAPLPEALRTLAIPPRELFSDHSNWLPLME